MRSILFFILFSSFHYLSAQTVQRQVIAGGGQDLASPQCRISFTIGEVTGSTLKNNGLTATQGFQQPVNMPLTAPLPVSLLYFTGALKAGHAKLEWKTTEEMNTCCFDLERSSNGVNFQRLTRVAAKGNSATTQGYQSIDSFPLSPMGYYRLKIIDNDGKFVYSPIVIVKSGTASGISLFPNPAHERVIISVSSTSKNKDILRILNLNGQEVMQKQVLWTEGVNTVSLAIAQLPGGLYTIRSETRQFPALQFIKQ